MCHGLIAACCSLVDVENMTGTCQQLGLLRHETRDLKSSAAVRMHSDTSLVSSQRNECQVIAMHMGTQSQKIILISSTQRLDH